MLALLAVVAGLFVPAAAPPPPNAPLPIGAAPIAQRLAVTTQALHAAVDLWRASEATRPPRELRFWALHQQRVFLALGLARPELGKEVVDRLPRELQPNARDVLRARRSLVRLTPPTTLPLSSFRTGPAEPASRLLGHYREAQRRFGVPWEILASVNFVETAFGKVRSRSTAGAQGPMQFLPATWRAYGLGGDIHDPRDSILGAANYLRASGAPGNLRRALYSYNHSTLYVDAILAYAAVLRRDLRAFYGFHAWQVFVRTPDGYRRITKP